WSISNRRLMPAPTTFAPSSFLRTAIFTTFATDAIMPVSACRSLLVSCQSRRKRAWCGWRNWRWARVSQPRYSGPSTAAPTIGLLPKSASTGPPSNAAICCTTKSAASTSTRSTNPMRRGRFTRILASPIPVPLDDWVGKVGSLREPFVFARRLSVIQCTYKVITGWGRSMIKKLTQHGNSWALVIDKPVLDLLKIDPSTPLEITTDGQLLVVAPAKDAKRKAKFKQALEETNRKYGRALKRLAD